MSDADNSLPLSKKRAAGRELSRDNPGLDDAEDSAEQESGTFKRASDEVLATRKIVKVSRKKQTSSTTSTNPFANIRLVTTSEPSETKDVATAAEPSDPAAEVMKEAPASEEAVPEGTRTDAGQTEAIKDENNQQSESKIDNPVKKSEKIEGEDSRQPKIKTEEPTAEAVAAKGIADNPNITVGEAIKNETSVEELAADSKTNDDKSDDKAEKDTAGGVKMDKTEGVSLNSFQQLSSTKNAFTGLAGTGLSTSTFSFASSASNFAGTFGQGSEQPAFGFGLSTNGNSALFGTTGTSIVSKNEGSGFPSMQEVPVETGEENERVVFSGDSVLFEYLDGGWKERGKGELKLNVSTAGTERARLLMRARGNYRLILNARLFSDMKLTNMDKRGITFACVNSVGEGKEGLSTFALKFKDGSLVEDFRAAVMAHKGKTSEALKTPENSPKASGS